METDTKYAVNDTGGKQYRDEEGQQLMVELLGHSKSDSDLRLRPVLLVEAGEVLATPEELVDVTVTARVLGRGKGPKIRGFTYKNKSNQRRRWGHRQHYDQIEILEISRG